MVISEKNIYLNAEYAQKNPTYHVERSAWKAEQILKMMRTNNLDVNTIAEIGCGAGEILRQLQCQLPKKLNFSGYEISPQALQLCKQRENDRLNFYQEDLLAVDCKPFDLLLCMDVIEHIDDYIGFVQQLRSKAHKIIFHIPLDMSVQTVLRRKPILHVRSKVGHIHYFMKDTALATLTEAGYEVLHWFYTPGSITTPQSLKARTMMLPRKLLFSLDQNIAVRVLGGYSLLVLVQ